LFCENLYWLIMWHKQFLSFEVLFQVFIYYSESYIHSDLTQFLPFYKHSRGLQIFFGTEFVPTILLPINDRAKIGKPKGLLLPNYCW
jgi:hypothetical protein